MFDSINNSRLNEQKAAGFTALLLAALLYGGNIVSARLIAGSIPPIALSLFRGLLGLAVIYPLARRSLRENPKPNRKELCTFALMGFLGITVAYCTLLWAAQYSSATNISIIFATFPAVTNAILIIGWKIAVPKARIAGIVLSFFGLLIVITQGSFSQLLALNLMLSDLMLFVNVVAVAFFVIIGQGVMEKFSPLVATTYSLLFGTIFLAPYGIWEALHTDWHFNSMNITLLLYMGLFVTGLAVLLNLEGVKRLGSGKGAIMNNMQPVFGIIFAYIFLDERLMAYHGLGFALVLAGVAFCFWPEKQPKQDVNAGQSKNTANTE